MASSIVPLCHYAIICVTIYSKHGRRVVPLISHCALAFLYPRPPTEQTNPNQRKHQAGPGAGNAAPQIAQYLGSSTDHASSRIFFGLLARGTARARIHEPPPYCIPARGRDSRL